MAFTDWAWGTGFWGEDPDDFDPRQPEDWWGESEWDAYHEVRNEDEKQERAAEERKRRLDLENKLRQYPPNCGFCGSAFEEEVTYGDDDYECVGIPYVYQRGRYECGTEIDSRSIKGVHDRTYRRGGLVAEDDKREPVPWQDRVKGGQTKACRTIMDLRWKTDRVALERDRTDTRTIDEVRPLTAEELTAKLRYEHVIEDWKKLLASLERTDVWTDAKGVVRAIPRMDERHRRNLLGFLERKAEMAHRVRVELFFSTPAPTSDMASLAWQREERELAETVPVEWMRSTPLYRAVKASLPPLPTRGRTEEVPVISATPPPPPANRPHPS